MISLLFLNFILDDAVIDFSMTRFLKRELISTATEIAMEFV